MTIARMLIVMGVDDKDVQKRLSGSINKLELFAEAASRVGRALSLGITLPATLMARSILESTVNIDGMRHGLIAMTGSIAEAERQMERLKLVAKEPGIGFEEAVQGSLALQAVGFSAQDAERSLKAFANAVAASGRGRFELERVVYQFTQMAAAGKVLGQDLRPMVQQVPLLAKALNDTFGTVNAAQIQGLTTDFKDFFNTFIPALESMPDVGESARTAVENVTDSWMRFKAAIGEQVLPTLVPLLDKMTAMLDKAEDLDPALVRWGIAIGVVAAAAGPFILLVSSLTTAISLLKIATDSAMISLVRMLGPIGLAFVAVGALTAYFIQKKLAMDAVTQAANDQSAAIEKLTGKYQNLSKEDLLKRHSDYRGDLSSVYRQLEEKRGEVAMLEEWAANSPGRHRGENRWDNQTDRLVEAREAVKELEGSLTFLKEVVGPTLAEALEIAFGGSDSKFVAGADLAAEALKATRDEASLLVQALELFPAYTDQWVTAQERGRALMIETNNLAYQQADALGEIAIGYLAIARNLQEALGVSPGSFGALERLSDMLAGFTPSVISSPAREKEKLPMERVAAHQMGTWIQRYQETLDAIHEYRMATDAAYAAQWLVNDELTNFAHQLQISKEMLIREFTNPGETMRRAGNRVADAALELVSSFTPLGIVTYLIAQLMEGLAPAITALLSPIKVLADALLPPLLAIFEALFPIIKMFAIAMTYVAEVILHIMSWIQMVVGKVVYAIGWALDKLPFSGDHGLKTIGKNLQDAAKASSDAADSMGDARDKIRNLDWNNELEKATENMKKLNAAVIGAVQGYKVASARHEAALPGLADPIGGGNRTDTGRTAEPRDRPVIESPVFAPVINLPENDPGGAYRTFYEVMRDKVRGRSSQDLARMIFQSLPRPS